MLQRTPDSRSYSAPASGSVLGWLEHMVVKLKLKAQFQGLTLVEQVTCDVLCRLVTMGWGSRLRFDEARVHLEHLGFASDEIEEGWAEVSEWLNRVPPGPSYRIQSSI